MGEAVLERMVTALPGLQSGGPAEVCAFLLPPTLIPTTASVILQTLDSRLGEGEA